jgi:hypothetical protein
MNRRAPGDKPSAPEDAEGSGLMFGWPVDEPIMEDVCGFCNLPGADKIPHPVRWPGEVSAGTEFVHADCENDECKRAHAALSDKQRQSFLRSL